MLYSKTVNVNNKNALNQSNQLATPEKHRLIASNYVFIDLKHQASPAIFGQMGFLWWLEPIELDTQVK